MNDSQDPYADRPYVPPTGSRGTEDPAAAENTDTTAANAAGSPASPHGDPAMPDHGAPSTETAQAPTRPDGQPSTPHGDPLTRPDPPHASQEGPAGPGVPPSGPDRQREAHTPEGGPVPPGGPHPSDAGTESTAVLGAPPPGAGEPPSHDSGSRSPRRGRFIAAAVGIVLLAGASGVGGAALYDEFSDGSAPSLRSSDTGTSLDDPATTELPAGTVEQVAQEVMPSVVQINFAGGGEGGSGSGVIISSDGKILTNNHVVEGAADGGTLTVAFNDGKNAPATIVGRDPATDVAVIQAEGVSGLDSAEFGRSSEVRVGQEVVAIGSPFGLESTVTQGIVSALNRPVTPGDGSGPGDTVTTFPAIQTDAAINPGNSGGPLVDLEGRVIGINSAIRSSGIEGGSIGLGFAIPSDLARNVAAQILEGKTVEHARIGITVQNATGEDQITGIGARVADIEPGGPGDEAGLQDGDIVTAVDDHPVAGNQALIATIRGYQPGDEVTLTIVRDGDQQQVEVTLGSDQGDLAR